ncbi:TraB/GumN family protein [Pseudaestuariivita sp.]|uniref:TraB/GumN family protein n=1 Tax=Pseudaestuariivita sp. TaxID=2211669 RepID=UPI004058F013
MFKSALRLAAALTCLWPAVALAQCTGTDLRTTLSQDFLDRVDVVVAETSYSEGNHWRATKDAHVLHLVGTFHMDDPRMEAIVARLRPVIETSERLFVEAAPEDQERFEAQIGADPSMFLRLEGPTLPDLLPEETWQTLRTQLADRGLPAVMAAKMQPWFLSMMLGLPACAMEAMATSQGGLDGAITDLAEALEVPITGLEAPEEVMSAINALPLQTQLDMLVWGLPMAAYSEDLFVTLRDAYFEEKHAFIWHFGSELARESGLIADVDYARTSAEVSDVMLDTRNAAWMEMLLGASEERVMVAVGAAHLFGETGLLQALEDAGYTLERLPF